MYTSGPPSNAHLKRARLLAFRIVTKSLDGRVIWLDQDQNDVKAHGLMATADHAAGCVLSHGSSNSIPVEEAFQSWGKEVTER